MTANDDHTTERTELEPGDTLYDGDSGEEYAVIVDIDDAGVTMRRGDTEHFLPHALFAPWNDAGLVVSKPKGCERRKTRFARFPDVGRGNERNGTGERERDDTDAPEQVC